MSAVAAPLRPTTPARPRLLWPFALLCVAGASVAGVLAGGAAITASLPLFLALAVVLAALDSVESRTVGGGMVSPTGVPAIAIALLFGPGGVVLAEALTALKRLALGRTAPFGITLDLGSLALSGAAAWAVAHRLPGEGPLVLLTGLVAGVAYFVVNNAILVVAWWLNEGTSPVRLARERVLDSTAYEVSYGVVAALLVYATSEMGVLALALVGVPIVALWLGEVQSAGVTRRHVEELTAANERLRALMSSTVESLARTIEARDPYTGGHTERVGEFALRIAEELGFGREDLQALALGAVIHDVGKIGIPDAILLKPGALDEAEWATMRSHPEIGSYILDELELPEHAKAMARHHHERWDGGGYPDGLAGEDIPLAARVLTVADALDAMTTDRPYRKALTMEVALAELEAKAGTQFCPRAVAAARAVISA